MGGKRWQKLHRLIYITAVLGVIHYYWLVKSDERKPAHVRRNRSGAAGLEIGGLDLQAKPPAREPTGSAQAAANRRNGNDLDFLHPRLCLQVGPLRRFP